MADDAGERAALEALAAAGVPPEAEQEAAWGKTKMTMERLEDLANRGVLPAKETLAWRLPGKEKRPFENTGEVAVFAHFVERGFSTPSGDFFRGLLHYYGLELSHLNPNGIFDISFFIYFCEAFLGIAPHFHLWRYLYRVKRIGSGPRGDGPTRITGGAGIALRMGRQKDYFDLQLLDCHKEWRRDWFYMVDQPPLLPSRTGKAPKEQESWRALPVGGECNDIPELMSMISGVKQRGLTAMAVTVSFVARTIQPIKDRVHPAFEFSGRLDPARETSRGFDSDEVMRRVGTMMKGEVNNLNAPRPFALKNPPPAVRFPC